MLVPMASAISVRPVAGDDGSSDRSPVMMVGMTDHSISDDDCNGQDSPSAVTLATGCCCRRREGSGGVATRMGGGRWCCKEEKKGGGEAEFPMTSLLLLLLQAAPALDCGCSIA
nr:hypothetical protein Iba_chr03bCG1680 [Ipomoea batatas]